MTPDNVDLDDENVWKSIREDTTMIFQWESDSAQAYLKKFMSDETLSIAKSINPNFSFIKWFSFGNGLIRPGCASFRDDVASGHINTTGFKELDSFLAITLGRITMQEDIMRFCKEFCGYSDAESDTVRRGIAKKRGTADLIGEMHDRFLQYSHEQYGVPTEKLEEIFPPIKQGILDASSYAFSWNHSDAYSCIGYISGYLRYYYPLEFITAALNTFTGKEDKIASITAYAKRNGISIMPIKFRHSRSNYTLDKESGSIYKGMNSIKFMNEEVSEALYAMRNDTFDSFIDLIARFPGNRKQLEILIRLGFFDEFGKTLKLIKTTELFDKLYGKKNIKKDGSWLPVEMLKPYATSETPKMLKFDDDAMNKMLHDLEAKIPDQGVSISSTLKSQAEFLGYIDYKEPRAKFWGIILSVDTTYSPKMTVYCFESGETIVVKMAARRFNDSPLVAGDLIQFTYTEKPASKKTEDGWVIDTTKPMVKWFNVVYVRTEQQYQDFLKNIKIS